MSALPSAITIPAAAPTPAAPPAPRGAEWLDCATAAERRGVSVRRVAQLAAGKWAARELARRVGAGAGKWEVRDDAHPQLARVLFPESMPFDWSPLTAGQRIELQQRIAIVAEQQATEPGPGPGPGIKPVRSPFEDQLPAIASAMNRQEHRQAAGAETVPMLSTAEVRAALRNGVHEPVAEAPASIDLLREWHAAQRSNAP